MDVLTSAEAAAELGLKRRQVLNLVYAGVLEGRRLGPHRGGQWAISRSSVEALKERRKQATSQDFSQVSGGAPHQDAE